MANETLNPGIYVCGAPSSGTSAVAGILHHLGVNMGNFDPAPGFRGYVTFEDRDAAKFTRPIGRHPGDSTLAFMAGSGGARDFRAYLAMREAKANGKPWGCKLGTNYPLDDPEPETLPVRWVLVDRSLEISIRSDLEKTKPSDPVERSMQVAGYWAAKDWLAREKIGGALHLDFDAVKRYPHQATVDLCAFLSLPADYAATREAAATIWRTR